jgi:hypothetical protein
MLQEFSYYLIFGRPLIMYLGIITIVSFLITASIPLLHRRGVVKIPLVWHMRVAGIAIALGLIHGTLGVAVYF